MEKIIQILDLPRVPDWIFSRLGIDQRPDMAKFNPLADLGHMSIEKHGDWAGQEYQWIKPMTSNKNARHIFDEECTKWFQENIAKNFNTKNSGWMFFEEVQLPHTDITREWVMLYCVYTGGPTSLSIWQQKGHALMREPYLALETYDDLELVEQVVGPAEHTWYMFNTQMIHSVENMTGVRLNLQLSFDHGITPEFV